MDRLWTSSAPCVHSEGLLQRVPTHPQSAEPNPVNSTFSFIPLHDLPVATSTSTAAFDPNLSLKIERAEFYRTRLRSYWTAVADDLGPLIWTQPNNIYRQTWEQEFSAADRKLQNLIDQIRKTTCRTDLNPNEDLLSSRLRDIDEDNNHKINAHDSPHRLHEALKVVQDSERKASNKRTLKRKATRQRAKARRSATKASSAISLTTPASATTPITGCLPEWRSHQTASALRFHDTGGEGGVWLGLGRT